MFAADAHAVCLSFWQCDYHAAQLLLMRFNIAEAHRLGVQYEVAAGVAADGAAGVVADHDGRLCRGLCAAAALPSAACSVSGMA